MFIRDGCKTLRLIVKDSDHVKWQKKKRPWKRTSQMRVHWNVRILVFDSVSRSPMTWNYEIMI